MLIPVERTNHCYRFPLAVILIIAVNVIVYSISLNGFDEMILEYGFIPNSFEFRDIFTAMFLHGEYVSHIAGNMFFLYLYGDNIEDVLGPVAFIAVYLAGGFSAALFSFMFNNDSSAVHIGASGAISGILGIYLVFFPKVKADLYLGRIRIAMVTVRTGLLIWFTEQFVFMILFESEHVTTVAFSSHFGGMCFGIIAGFVFRWWGFLAAFGDRIRDKNARKWMISCPSCNHPVRIRKTRVYVCSECGTSFKHGKGVSCVTGRD